MTSATPRSKSITSDTHEPGRVPGSLFRGQPAKRRAFLWAPVTPALPDQSRATKNRTLGPVYFASNSLI